MLWGGTTHMKLTGDERTGPERTPELGTKIVTATVRGYSDNLLLEGEQVTGEIDESSSVSRLSLHDAGKNKSDILLADIL